MKRPLLPYRLVVNINEKMIRSMSDRMIINDIENIQGAPEAIIFMVQSLHNWVCQT